MCERRQYFDTAFGRTTPAYVGTSIGSFLMSTSTNSSGSLLDRALQCLRRGDLPAAHRWCRKAVAADPRSYAARINYAEVLRKLGWAREAEAEAREGMRLEPRRPEAYVCAAMILRESGRLEDSAAELRRALAIRPADTRVLMQLGYVLYRLEAFSEAQEVLDRAVNQAPGSEEAHLRRGVVLACRGKLTEAEAAFRRAVGLNPRSSDAFFNLGNLMRERHRPGDAADMLRKALEINPESAPIRTNLAESLMTMGDVDGALEQYRRAVAMDKQSARARENLIYCMNFVPEASGADIYREHCRWAAMVERGEDRSPVYEVDPDPSRALRVGYVSPDFSRHPVGAFILPLLKHHNKARCEVVCFSDVSRSDSRTDQCRASASEWHDIRRLSDGELAETVRAGRIDILVDCAGHTRGNRLGAFARRPAPIQLTCVGYPTTTGLRSMQYYITDDIVDPPGAESCFSEQLVRLKTGFCCYEPPATAPEPASTVNGAVTFGSLHHLARLNREVISLWAGIVRRVPGARLKILRDAVTDRTRARLTAWFADYGIEAERVDITNELPPGGHLHACHGIDIALDTFPWSGHTTACEALWMGVPVVSLRGRRHAGRMVAGILSRVGLESLVAETREDYVDIAVELAADRRRRASLRRSLRDTMRGSVLCDGPGFAEAMEDAYRAMWRSWCRGQEPVEEGR